MIASSNMNLRNLIDFQPSGNINCTHFLFKKVTYRASTDFCKNSFEKNNAKNCLIKYPDNWWCIYENCISPSKNTEHIIKIRMPPYYL